MKRKWNNTARIIKTSRLKTGMSQLDLSKKVIGKSGNGQFFWNIEAGKAGLPPKHLFKTSQILMITLHDLKEAMIQDYRDNLESMIKYELDNLKPVPKQETNNFSAELMNEF